ncbi:MAG: hypothetical protein V7603_6232 [Micromonosporaceae bacterium]
MQHDRSPDDLRVGSWIPTQRTGSTAQPPPPSTTPAPPAPSPVNEATVVLPVFVTGKKPEQPPAQQAMAETTLPSSERGMLLFVAALLGLGTVAVVAMMGFGLAGTPTKPKPPVAVTASASPAVAVPAPIGAPATPSAPASPTKAAPSRTPAAKRSPAPTQTTLGTLSTADVIGYCQDTSNGMPLPPSRGRNSWTCFADRGQRQEFAPTDVCRWRFHDNGARAVVGDLNNPSTWRCYT